MAVADQADCTDHADACNLCHQESIVIMASGQESPVAASNARVQVLEEVSKEMGEGWNLCFQWCRYIYDNGTLEEGYRFIWRRPNHSLQAARGQARIPSIKIMKDLVARAEAAGWGAHEG
jgi:hypothetical protein